MNADAAWREACAMFGISTALMTIKTMMEKRVFIFLISVRRAVG